MALFGIFKRKKKTQAPAAVKQPTPANVPPPAAAPKASPPKAAQQMPAKKAPQQMPSKKAPKSR